MTDLEIGGALGLEARRLADIYGCRVEIRLDNGVSGAAVPTSHVAHLNHQDGPTSVLAPVPPLPRHDPPA